jgi:hypothetical protein
MAGQSLDLLHHLSPSFTQIDNIAPKSNIGCFILVHSCCTLFLYARHPADFQSYVAVILIVSGGGGRLPRPDQNRHENCMVNERGIPFPDSSTGFTNNKKTFKHN